MRRIHVLSIVGVWLFACDAPAQDGPKGTVLVANMNDDSVWLVDVESGTRRGRLATHIAPHEIAVSADGELAVVTNYGDQRGPGNLLQVFDVTTGAVLRELVIEGYERLHGVAFLPGDSTLVLTSERTGELLVVGLVDGAIRRKLSTHGEASHMLALGGDWIYAANIVSGTVSRIDPSGLVATKAWPAGTRTEGVAATPDGSQGWTGSMDAGTVVGLDGETGRIVATVEDLRVPYRLAVTPDGRSVVVSDPEAEEVVLIDRVAGVISARIDMAQASGEAGLGNQPSPQGFVLSRDGRWAFVSMKAIDRVAVIDLPAQRVLRFLEAGAGPDGISFSPVVIH